MIKDKIVESNKLIAEFMGYEYIGWNDERHRCSGISRGYWGLKGAKVHHLKTQHTMMFNPLLYHSSFDWIMPVVSKIEGMGADSSITMQSMKHKCHFTLWEKGGLKFINGEPSETKIEAIYSAILEFIKYNTYSK